MLKVQDLCKTYVTGTLRQQALDHVTLGFRDHEFVAILGPSGSGKTTLLNVIGGLDRYDSGEMTIEQVSTSHYTDRDWDAYRNHKVGFVFQNYHLIPHQSVLSNVELALTIGGVSGQERRRKAEQALREVGLEQHMHKKPNQLSGGQMQRVAIARALVNDPEIVLADEPTGALDTATSVQVMELLKKVSKQRLVIMVTHNPELAEKYATRIVRLQDGKVMNDTDPVQENSEVIDTAKPKSIGKAHMSLMTALQLSLSNLRTKKARTLLTAFAGSIGIIGIALILSLSNGVNQYIADIQKSTMTSYPITIQAQSVDLSSIMRSGRSMRQSGVDHLLDGVYADETLVERVNTMTGSVRENNLTAFKRYLDDESSAIRQYIGSNGIVYGYDVQFNFYTEDPDGHWVNMDGSALTDGQQNNGTMMRMMSSMMGNTSENPYFEELLPGPNGRLISPAIQDDLEVLYGRLPENWDEMLLILDENNEIPLTALYALGYLPGTEYRELMQQLQNGEQLTIETIRWDYASACEKTILALPICDTYLEREDGTYTKVTDLASLLPEKGMALKIVGVVRKNEETANTNYQSVFAYTSALTDQIIAHTLESPVVKAQIAQPDYNVLTGLTFAPRDDSEKAEAVKQYFSSLSSAEKAQRFREMLEEMPEGMNTRMQAMQSMSDGTLARMLDQYILGSQANTEMLISLYDRYLSTGSYEENMESFGVVNFDAPSSISIYTDSFEDKDGVSDCIRAYNDTVSEEYKITYTDYVGLLMSSVTTIVNVISYVLIAFVAVSLIVSSIMIGIITYISVLERTREIGILRAIGASKRNISEVFNAETLIIGFLSGVLGIGVTLALLIPGNAVIHHLTESNGVNAFLPVRSAGILVLLSVILTLIGGLIPSRKAARKDPVTALRTE